MIGRLIDATGMPRILVGLYVVFGIGITAMGLGVGSPKVSPASTTPAPAAAVTDPKAQAPKPGVISQSFGANEKAYKKFGVKGHTGIDVAADCSIPAFAPATGTVVGIGDDPEGYGHFVRLATYGGESITLGHFEQVLVKKGQTIPIGTQIATVGTSGNSTGCHVHFELHPRDANPKNGFGGAVDPKDWKPTECGLKDVPAAFGEYFCAASQKYPIKAAMVAAIMTYENRFNVKGFPDQPLTYPWPCSHAGACGAGQFIEPTWEAYGVDGPALYPGDGGGDGKADRNSFSDAVFSTARYLAAIAEKKPDPLMVAAEYNCGPKCGGPFATWPNETKDYAPNVVKLRNQFMQ